MAIPQQTVKGEQKAVNKVIAWFLRFGLTILIMGCAFILLYQGFLFLRAGDAPKWVMALAAIVWGVGGIAVLYYIFNALVELLPLEWTTRLQPFVFVGPAIAMLLWFTVGLTLAVALRSAPRVLLERRTGYCEIVNVGLPAWRLGARGDRIGPAIAHGEMLYAGPCMLAAASTVPFYGLGLRAFPFALRAAGMMHLRVATTIGVPTLLLNIPRIWSGDFSHEGLLDFHAERVLLRFERPMPLQIGGDAEGWRDEVEFGMAASPVELVDFGARAAA